jgi:pyruvate dehydrogenase E1 component
LLGSGAILREVIAAGELLAADWQISGTVWSVTSFSELARDARETVRYNRLHPEATPRTSHVATCLSDNLPIIAATDYVVAYPQLISAYVRQPFLALGTDSFGRSDTRATLRRFFLVDRHHIVLAALHTLAQIGSIARSVVSAAINRYAIDPHNPPPWMQ